MICFDCGKEFKTGDKVYEFTSGMFDGYMVCSDESLEAWCEDCERKRGKK